MRTLSAPRDVSILGNVHQHKKDIFMSKVSGMYDRYDGAVDYIGTRRRTARCIERCFRTHDNGEAWYANRYIGSYASAPRYRVRRMVSRLVRPRYGRL
jgi:hypothetical protein